MTHLINTSSFNTAVCTTIYTTNRRINIMQPSQKKEWFAILGRLTIFSAGIQYYFLGWQHIRKRSYFKINMSMVANHAPSVPIRTQFLSGSMSVNLAFQLSDKTLKSSHPHFCIIRPGSFWGTVDDATQSTVLLSLCA